MQTRDPKIILETNHRQICLRPSRPGNSNDRPHHGASNRVCKSMWRFTGLSLSDCFASARLGTNSGAWRDIYRLTHGGVSSTDSRQDWGVQYAVSQTIDNILLQFFFAWCSHLRAIYQKRQKENSESELLVIQSRNSYRYCAYMHVG